MSYADLYRSRVGWKEGIWPVLQVGPPVLSLGRGDTYVRYDELPCRCGAEAFLFDGVQTRAGIRVFIRCRNWTAETAHLHSPVIQRMLPYPPLDPTLPEGCRVEWDERTPEA